MAAIAWTLVGLMAGSLGVLSAALYSGLARIDAVGTRVDSLGTRLDDRIDSLSVQVESRMDSLGGRLESRMDSLGGRLEAQGTDIRADIRELRLAVTALDHRLTRTGA